MISNENYIISDKLFQNNYLKLSIGKKRHIKIEKD
jgi:tyrosyl-tRNA synthetase